MRRSARIYLSGFLVLVSTLGLPANLQAANLKPARPNPGVIIPVTDAAIVHLLNRIGFGPAPGDIAAVRQIGIDAYIDRQLNPVQLPPSLELEQRLRDIPDLNQPIASLAASYQPPIDKKDLSEDERKAYNEKLNDVLKNTMQAKILRAILSPAQLQEVMTDFWYNHFNVFADKGGEEKIFVGAYERDAIRPYALGKFRDLLLATASHPAMLIYLDNWLNTDPDSMAAHGKKIGINENYAREVMELHTLGVNGGYTQSDVTTLAHILTGWGLASGPGWVPRATFMFDPRRHDAVNMLFLNNEIRGGGADEIVDVLSLLAREPATAHHIAFQLAQYFVADNPPKALVDRLAGTYLQSDGDIKTVLRALLHSREFWDPANAQNKFKPPLRYVISALRASGIVPQGNGQIVYGTIGQMGEPLYRCLTPNGYANTNDQWLNSDALLKRIDFSRGLGRFMPQDRDPSDTIIATRGGDWTANSVIAIRNAEPKMRPVMALSSPEFVYY
jgi:uncharacterized protein (DUF1800 family)